MWIDLLNNSNPILKIYGEDQPSLDAFLMKGVKLDYLKNSLEITGDLSSFPKNPPSKWAVNKFNTVHIVLEFWNISSFQLEKYQGVTKVDLRVTFENGNIICNTESGLRCSSELFDLKEISGYQNNDLSKADRGSCN